MSWPKIRRILDEFCRFLRLGKGYHPYKTPGIFARRMDNPAGVLVRPEKGFLGPAHRPG